MNVNFDKLDNILYNFKTDIISDINKLDLNIINKNSFLPFHKIRSITKHFFQLLVILNTKLQFLII